MATSMSGIDLGRTVKTKLSEKELAERRERAREEKHAGTLYKLEMAKLAVQEWEIKVRWRERLVERAERRVRVARSWNAKKWERHLAWMNKQLDIANDKLTRSQEKVAELLAKLE